MLHIHKNVKLCQKIKIKNTKIVFMFFDEIILNKHTRHIDPK